MVSRKRRKDMFVKEKKKEIEGGGQAAVVLGTIQAKRKEMFKKEVDKLWCKRQGEKKCL